MNRRNTATRSSSTPLQHYVRASASSRVHRQSPASDPSWQRAQEEHATASGQSHKPRFSGRPCGRRLALHRTEAGGPPAPLEQDPADRDCGSMVWHAKAGASAVSLQSDRCLRVLVDLCGAAARRRRWRYHRQRGGVVIDRQLPGAAGRRTAPGHRSSEGQRRRSPTLSEQPERFASPLGVATSRSLEWLARETCSWVSPGTASPCHRDVPV
jgi:hypothetical protein